MNRTTTAGRRTPARFPRAPGAGHPWARLLAGVLLILVFAFGVIPGLQRLGPVREVRNAIRDADIDASALFYTECEMSSEAEASIRDALRHSARRANQPPATTHREIDAR